MAKSRIIPNLWFDTEAKEAAGFYTSVFPGSRIASSTILRDTPAGDTDVVAFDLAGHRFMAISAGPLFKFGCAVEIVAGRRNLLLPMRLRAEHQPARQVRSGCCVRRRPATISTAQPSSSTPRSRSS